MIPAFIKNDKSIEFFRLTEMHFRACWVYASGRAGPPQVVECLNSRDAGTEAADFM